MAAGDGTTATIGKSVQIRGEVKGSEDLLVDGLVEGTITLTESRLTIGAEIYIDAQHADSKRQLFSRRAPQNGCAFQFRLYFSTKKLH